MKTVSVIPFFDFSFVFFNIPVTGKSGNAVSEISSTFCVPGTVLGTEDAVGDQKKGKILALMELMVQKGR